MCLRPATRPAAKVDDAWVCKAYSEDIDELFDEVTADPARCMGCEPWLAYPETLVAQAVEHSESECRKDSEIYRRELKAGKCVKLEPNGDGTKVHWKMLGPKAQGELACTGSPRLVDAPSFVKKKNFFRGCEIEREGTCKAQDQVCAKKGFGPTCVYRLGEAECPTAYPKRKDGPMFA